ncbi:MAG TPA: transcription-repair coupling factor [Firmicutes bacterium]|nr:transcription-repair coupling factor [Candidatus Fermentithermobacillaceae bacterium]
MAHPGLLDLIARSDGTSRLVRAVQDGTTPAQVIGAQGYARLAVAAALFHKVSKPALFVFPSPEEAVTAKRDLGDLLGAERVLLFPAREVMPFETETNKESLWMRIHCLTRLCGLPGEPPVVVMPATAMVRGVMSPGRFRQGCRRYAKGDSVNPLDVVRDLVEAGYERVFSVEGKGQLALRGGILDIFPPPAETPYRLEFAFDEIESIRTFDVESQVSLDSVTEVVVTPATDSPDKQDQASGDSDEGSRMGFTVLDYLGACGLVMVDRIDKCRDVVTEFEKIGAEIASARMIAGTMGAKEASVYLPSPLVHNLLEKGHVMFSPLLRATEGVLYRAIIESDTSSQIGFAGRWADFLGEVRELLARDKRVVILAGNRDRMAMLKRFLDRQEVWNRSLDSVDSEPKPGLVTIALGSGESGFNVEATDLCVFTETEVYGRTHVRQRRARAKKAGLDWRELSAGDYVVHASHGIGQFMGMKTMTVNNVTRDYLYLRYAGSDALYVPVDQVDLIERYSGPEGKPPQLQKLGTGEWARIKARVKASVEDMARRLLTLEAKRKSRTGYAFGPDTPWQREFEDAFEYEDTEDQARATEEIKRDMEAAVPMDRLLCGDVGFGKTEVAMRCAFKAVMDGKQVGVLVPTTILAEQHYATFVRRFAEHPVTIHCLSRFRTPGETRKIVADIQSGSADIVIGTHRLLSKDVSFKNLGLLIVDEEHRFGVAQKERLKELSENCDVLTLTATPIPRTLNMALSGIRDISVIETPPEGRFPVETYVVPMNPSLLSQAIRREMRRGGQVFYVYNRIRSIGRVLQRVQAMVPEARIAVAHGRMNEHELSRTMQDFLQGRYDILISTTIIESGLDLPNVNTLIVEEADKLGLAQLYQLRGRVGRSNRIAYAYFTYRHDRSMTYIAEQRLNALRDFTTMGSGFKLAMRDMEIRGAGNLLGAEQHGFMVQVGYEMYVNLLDKAVRSLRGQKVERVERILTAVEVPVDAFIPESYINNTKERFAFYKRIAGAENEKILGDLEEELVDRYGQLPSQVRNLLDVARLRLFSGSIGVTQVTVAKEDVVLGRKKIIFKVEVPHLFPVDKVAVLHRRFPGAEFDRRAQALSVPLSQSGATPLEQGLTLALHLSRGE